MCFILRSRDYPGPQALWETHCSHFTVEMWLPSVFEPIKEVNYKKHPGQHAQLSPTVHSDQVQPCNRSAFAAVTLLQGSGSEVCRLKWSRVISHHMRIWFMCVSELTSAFFYAFCVIFLTFNNHVFCVQTQDFVEGFSCHYRCTSH